MINKASESTLCFKTEAVNQPRCTIMMLTFASNRQHLSAKSANGFSWTCISAVRAHEISPTAKFPAKYTLHSSGIVWQISPRYFFGLHWSWQSLFVAVIVEPHNYAKPCGFLILVSHHTYKSAKIFLKTRKWLWISEEPKQHFCHFCYESYSHENVRQLRYHSHLQFLPRTQLQRYKYHCLPLQPLHLRILSHVFNTSTSAPITTPSPVILVLATGN